MAAMTLKMRSRSNGQDQISLKKNDIWKMKKIVWGYSPGGSTDKIGQTVGQMDGHQTILGNNTSAEVKLKSELKTNDFNLFCLFP